MSTLFPSQEARVAFIAAMKIHGVAKALAEFSGSSDSGQVDEVTFLGLDGSHVEMDDTQLNWVRDVSSHVNGEWTSVTEEAKLSAAAIVEQMCYDALEETGLDWYNNDGGQGEFTIDFTTIPPAITLDVSTNYMQTDEHEFDFTSGEMDGSEDEEAA
jgi:hypothetical protein